MDRRDLSSASSASSAPIETATTAPDREPGSGRWARGNGASRGHGGGAHDLARWRRLCREATSEEDMRAVWSTLVACAKAGEPWAVHEFLDRTHGKAIPPEPEPAPGIQEIIREEYMNWLAKPPATDEETKARLQELSSQVCMLEAKLRDAKIRASRGENPFPDFSEFRSPPHQALVPGSIASVARPEVEPGQPALEREPRRRQTVQEWLDDHGGGRCESDKE